MIEKLLAKRKHNPKEFDSYNMHNDASKLK
jgi:hypothetical protein